MQEFDITPGQIIFREGDPSDSAYYILSGEVDIMKVIPTGTVKLASLGEGEVFGEMGMIDQAPRSAAAIASRPGRLRVIDANWLAAILAPLPQEALILMRSLMERLRETNQRLTAASLKLDHLTLVPTKPEGTPPAVKRILLKGGSEAVTAQIPDPGLLLPSLPYRIGGLPKGMDPNPLDFNHFILRDVPADHMSRHHFTIQRSEEGLIVADRGTPKGTWVNGETIGGPGVNSQSGGFRALLRPGLNDIRPGGEDSPYRFEVIWEA